MKSKGSYKTVKTENKEFHGMGGKADVVAVAKPKKGDSRSKSMLGPIKPQKSC
jgi:hypothetical protein